MKPIILLILVLFCFDCSNSSDFNNGIIQENKLSLWCVPESEIGGGTSFFPLLETPNYQSISFINSLNYLSENSKVAILMFNDDIFVFPYDFTNYYEVINTNLDNSNLIFSYCPLTQSALCFNNNSELTTKNSMKASGYLYKDNLILADSALEEYWSQMDAKVIRGTNKTERIQTYNLIETFWKVAQTNFPNAKVFYHENTNFCSGCETYEVATSYNNLFGVINEHVREDTVHLYNYNALSNNAEVQTITINGKKTIVVGNKNLPYFNAFYIPSSLEFSLLDASEFPLIIQDNENTKWDVFGRAIEGPRKGTTLNSPKCFIAGEWAWVDFYEKRILHF